MRSYSNTGWRLNTLLATTHIPLQQVSQALTPALVTTKLKTLASFCPRFTPSPELLLAGLKPHAGAMQALQRLLALL